MKAINSISLLIILVIASLFVGVSDISMTDILSLSEEQWLVLRVSRVPRTIALLLAGIGVSVCGLILQQMTQNKFVSPATAGTLDAAKFGILAALILLPEAGGVLKVLFTFAFTFLASLVFLKIADRIRYRNIIFIPIVGLLFGGILNSVTVFFAYQFNIVQDVGGSGESYGAWMVGDFSGVLEGNYELLYLCIPAVLLTYLYASKFTVVGLGKDFSKNLGLNYRSVLNIGLVCVSLTISVIAITIGMIPFLGLVVPNLTSLLLGGNLKKTLPFTAIFGAIFLLICDIIGRLIIFPFEVPIGMMVGVVGGVIFLVLLLKRNR
ncbi:ABC transporter permease [Algoriphagus vanfongensis]|uniref:ABC transporter permease n=1 Tax=Algoriphagus vanfongensis TaxID=426371 RepID=UPI00041A1B25|nr:iron chelate uptake ABC transporter family permease subunit [Algoriphagus vanfongensis]